MRRNEVKTPWIIGIVVVAHVAAIGTLSLMQGCGTTGPAISSGPETPMPPPAYEETLPAPGPAPRPAPAARPAATFPAQTTTYVVGKGDTLSGIAYRFNVSVKEIMALNDIKDANLIRSGQKLLLPGKISLEGGRQPAPKPVVQPPAGGAVYTVKSGDCLSVIASEQGSTVAAIREANGLKSDTIVVGQKLVIPGGTGTPRKPAAERAGTDRPAKPGPSENAPAMPSLELDAEPLMEGVAPAAKPAVEGAPGSAAPATSTQGGADQGGKVVERIHVVEANEDLYSVAMLWAVSVQELKDLNGLQGTELQPGQRLRIPLAE
jgi:LysM repeat protein